MVTHDLDVESRRALNRDLSTQIHSRVQAISAEEWRTLLGNCGFDIEEEFRAPMHLLEPVRMIADKGIIGAARAIANLLLDPEARERVLFMRRLFRRNQNHLGAIALIARRKGN